MMGIQVEIGDKGDVIGPCANALSESSLSPLLAARLFTALCGYRLVDVMALVGGVYPSATVVERTAVPTGTLQVCIATAWF